jgi:N-acetylmuramoyl-L-alanine amidase
MKEDALNDRTIVIDPGHGGRDSGAVGPTGYQEKNFNLAVSLKLKSMLERIHANVVLTREGDYNVGLNARIRRANNLNADFFLSVHANAASFTAHGTEQYVPYYADTTSRSIAQRMQNNITAALNTSDRGVKTANYAVLRNAQVSAALTEVAFISNSQEERKLRSEANQEQVAEALFQSIVNYFN